MTITNFAMINDKNKRLFITCSPKMEDNIKVLQEFYDLSTTELVKMLLAKEVSERIKH